MTDAKAVLEAVRIGDAATVERLLGDEPSLIAARDGQGISALLLSLYHGRRDIAELFLAAGREPDVHECAALGLADGLAGFVARDRTAIGSVSADRFTPLHLAAFFGHLEAARVLLEAGADVDAVAANPSRVRPLHSAAAGNHDALAELLLGAGADPNTTQARGYTPLMTAASRGNAALIRSLLERGADLASVAEDGRTASSLARERGHEDVLPLFGR